MSGSSEDPDLLAAEFVLGLLDPATHEDIVRRMPDDAALVAAVAAWQARLAPLAEAVLPVAPPADLWSRIEARLGPSAAATLPIRRPGIWRPGIWRNLALWRGATGASLALAAALALVVWLRPPAQPPALVAALTAAGSPAPGAVAYLAQLEPDGAVRVRATTLPTVPSDRDLELWALAVGATRPVSLGVLPPDGRLVPAGSLANAGLAPRTQLMVSLEPKGGSPTGQPTGPVLFAGTLLAMK
jgi:anti-sigma-K factor RskA